MLDDLLATASRLREPSGLVSVPALRRAGLSLDELLAAARSGWLELRPEDGMGYLSAEDAALCPTAWDGTPLSWARVMP